MKRLKMLALVLGSMMLGAAFAPAVSYAAQTVLSALPSTQTFYLDGEQVSIEAYNIGGRNYLQLNDLSKLLGVAVSYDGATNSVYIGEQPQQEVPQQPEPSETGEEVKLTLAERGKDNEKYPTVGHADTPNKNGYYTEANVDIGVARLEYQLLDLVNEARVAEGHAPLVWAPYDEMEEYTLLRAKELTHHFSHGRPTDLPGVTSSTAFGDEVIAGGGTPKEVFNAWMNSPGHKRTLMYDDVTFMCAARCYGSWIIKLGNEWTLATSIDSAPRNYNVGDPKT